MRAGAIQPAFLSGLRRRRFTASLRRRHNKTIGAVIPSMSLKAFSSQRVVTPQGVRPAAILVEGERINDIVTPADVPAGLPVVDFGNAAILPGLVDSHTHVNEPGRAEWEGFATASRAAAAGGYTTLVDMPLNCLPPTTTVQALEEKRACAARSSVIDFALWGGVVSNNQTDIEPLAAAGVPGFKCFSCIRVSTASRWSPSHNYALRCRTLQKQVCLYWSMPNCPVQLRALRKNSYTPTGANMRHICGRVLTMR